MNDLKRFENNLFQLEVKTNSGESLFNAEVVASFLEFLRKMENERFEV